ncbi:MAG: RNA polymerase sigma factor [Pseudomonadota bacterium]
MMTATVIDIGANRKTDEQSETQLVARARAGDTAAFAALYRAYSGRLYAVCLRLTADAAAAEDCVQEAFVSAWNALESFAGDSRFSTWLHRIAVNQALGVKRKWKRRGNHLKLVTPRTEEDGTVVDPLERVAAPAEDEDTRLDLEQAIAELPEQARKVFVLVALHGYTHEEAGAALHIAAGTSKAQLHRARQLLKQRLGAGEDSR